MNIFAELYHQFENLMTIPTLGLKKSGIWDFWSEKIWDLGLVYLGPVSPPPPPHPGC